MYTNYLNIINIIFQLRVFFSFGAGGQSQGLVHTKYIIYTSNDKSFRDFNHTNSLMQYTCHRFAQTDLYHWGIYTASLWILPFIIFIFTKGCFENIYSFYQLTTILLQIQIHALKENSTKNKNLSKTNETLF